ncbi:MAG: flagellar basal body P-ring protein FlgI [Candidatus Latescibacterota bacterium]|nr:flagellar basal body P-ring protein FlgI [Candidatus Latescibacterota bacterium]
MALCIAALSSVPTDAASAVRIKDLARIQMGEEVPLTGMGLIIGLEGTGDGRQATFTLRMLANMMNRLQLSVDPNAIRVSNIATVSATAMLSPFDRKGGHIDVQVASLGDASSLQGGTLLRTPLAGPDGKVYVQVQGPVSIGGFNLGSGAGSVRKNHTVVGSIPNGGLIVDQMDKLIDVDGHVELLIYEPDWTTAARMAWAIDEYFGEFGLASAQDAGTIQIRLDPQHGDPQLLTEFLAEVEKVSVVPDAKARVVVNERTGTVIIGENVSVAAVAMSHGSLTLKIPGEAEEGDLFGGEATVEEEPDHLHPIISSFDVGAMPTVRELVRNLNALGVTPRDLISILQSLKTAGALRAELIIQ